MLEHVAQQHGVEARQLEPAEVTGLELDVTETRARGSDVARRDVQAESPSARLGQRKGGDQLARRAADLHHAGQSFAAQQCHELRQLEVPHFEVDELALVGRGIAPRDVVGMGVVQRGEVDAVVRCVAHGADAAPTVPARAATTRSWSSSLRSALIGRLITRCAPLHAARAAVGRRAYVA